MDFGEAIRELKAGKRVTRPGWNGRGMWLALIREWVAAVGDLAAPSVTMKTSPFIVMKTFDDRLVPWLASQTDVLAADWEIVP